MTGRTLTGMLILLVALVAMAGCRRDETPEQRLERLRHQHEIYPGGATTIRTAEGEPSVLVDIALCNRGIEPLAKLTVLVKIVDENMKVRESRRVTLNLEDVQPGLETQISAQLNGLELAENEQVQLELEAPLTPEQLRELPEFATLQ